RPFVLTFILLVSDLALLNSKFSASRCLSYVGIEGCFEVKEKPSSTLVKVRLRPGPSRPDMTAGACSSRPAMGELKRLWREVRRMAAGRGRRYSAGTRRRILLAIGTEEEEGPATLVPVAVVDQGEARLELC
ncbi:MAG: hypothetical protein KC731_29195, partial [Myxococcales bacterium]|nr:hypothetical protein [Myxococcales bacterium]